MSYNQQKVVLEKSKTKGPQRLLLMVLAFHANKETGLCCPSHEMLVDETGMSLPTVKRVVGQLKDSGEVLVSDGRGRGNKNHYIITLGRGADEIKREVDDYEKKGIKFDTFCWENKVSEMILYNEEKGPNPEEKGINIDTSSDQKGISFEEKGINIDTSMLTKRTKTKKELKGELKPLAVHTYRKVARLYPDKALWQTLDETIGDKPEDLQFWEQVVTDWIGCGWRKTNLKGMIEHFERRELPTTGGETNGHKSGSRKPKANGAAQKGRYQTGGIPALEARNRYEKRANIATGETYWYDSETGERYSEPPSGMS